MKPSYPSELLATLQGFVGSHEETGKWADWWAGHAQEVEESCDRFTYCPNGCVSSEVVDFHPERDDLPEKKTGNR